MLEILQFACSSFWTFCGVVVLVSLVFVPPINAMCFIWNRWMRHLNIKSQGYPPPTCDADGDPIAGED